VVDSAFAATTNLLMPTRTVAVTSAAMAARAGKPAAGGILGSLAVVVVSVALASLAFSGCGQSAADANQRQLQDQQAQLDQLKQEVAALQNQHASYSTAASPPGACDPAVMAEATHKGGDRMASGDTAGALGFYQDAVTACPASAAAQLNLANTYETMGDRPEALRHYRIAAGAGGPDADAGAVDKARAALVRLGASS
jgi:hypothetical protein